MILECHRGAPRAAPKPGRAYQLPIAGFTLAELMVTLAVAGILMMVALPGMRTFIQNQRIASAASSLVYSMALARSEAVKRDVAAPGVTTCASSDGATCNPGGTWRDGWIVVTPPGVPPNPAPLQVVGPLSAGTTVTLQPAISSIGFQSTGQAALASAYVTFKFCDSRGGAFALAVEVTRGGRVQAGDKPGFDVAGVPLTCP